MTTLTKEKLLEASFRVSRLIESDATNQRHKFKVVLLTEGKGNAKDRYYYSQDCIDDPITSAAFEGKPFYLNHPSTIEEQTIPERRVQDIGGTLTGVHPEGNALVADASTLSTSAGVEAASLMMEALRFAQENPGKQLVGFSINADGDVEGDLKDETGIWKNVIRIPEAVSADIVTTPARGGKVVGLLESEQEPALSDKLKQMREVIEVGIDGGKFPLGKTLKRMVDDIITTAEREKGGSMFLPAQPAPGAPPVAGAPAPVAVHVAPPAPGGNLKAEAYKHMAERCQSEGNVQLAETYRRMAAEAEAEGRTTEAEKENESEKKQSEKKTAEGEDEDEEESEEESEKKTTESLRKENSMLKAEKKLRESGLDAVYHPRILRECVGKTDKEVDELIESTCKEHEHVLREASVPQKFGAPGTDTKTKVDGILAAHRL